MLTLHTKIDSAPEVHDTLVLSYEGREKCRQRARLGSGQEAALFTVRGTVLRDGDLLKGDDGRIVRVVAAPEPTYLIRCIDARALARCAFHLGNRHTQTEVGADYLRIRVDPVLKEMVEGLGARVEQQDAPFEPEQGAYSAAGHSHGERHLLAPVPLRQKIHRPGDRDRA
jgi:urease accessory protein